ncbi:FHA domain-containing protein [Nocardioides zeae]|uniref:FHA domain-containing protein n=1 Tax=Nocardioides imazamoxiresistens TaxID=3231893 RepID=A0ABU3PWB0_9ACTN|nr:FHA domain-containing protein [Nocardioides zeae]MDT9593530.1 FHA domain-containing protein [Nocardioides zeae]
MGWAVVVVAVMSLVGAGVGAALAYLWGSRREREGVRTPLAAAPTPTPTGTAVRAVPLPPTERTLVLAAPIPAAPTPAAPVATPAERTVPLAVLPPPGAVRPAVRGRGAVIRGVDEVAVMLPGGGYVRVASGSLVGRADGCRVMFRLAKVSRRHAVMYAARGSWWIGDLGSTNGTIVDGVAVQGAAELREGSYVRVGGREGIGFTVRSAVVSADVDSPSAA